MREGLCEVEPYEWTFDVHFAQAESMHRRIMAFQGIA